MILSAVAMFFPLQNLHELEEDTYVMKAMITIVCDGRVKKVDYDE